MQSPRSQSPETGSYANMQVWDHKKGLIHIKEFWSQSLNKFIKKNLDQAFLVPSMQVCVTSYFQRIENVGSGDNNDFR